MLKFDFRKFVTWTSVFHARPRAKWVLGLLAAVCLIQLSAQSALAGPPDGCTGTGDFAVYDVNGEVAVGFTWNDTDQAYEDANNDKCLFISYFRSGYNGVSGYFIEIQWELDAYDTNGHYIDSWTQDDGDDWMTYDQWIGAYSADSNCSPWFNGAPDTAGWIGCNALAQGCQVGVNGVARLYEGSDKE